MSTPAGTLTLHISTDKEAYEPGDTITVTLKAFAPAQLTVTGSATAADGTAVSAEATVQVNVLDPAAQLGISDSFNDSFSIVSNSGGVGVFSAVITPPAAQ